MKLGQVLNKVLTFFFQKPEPRIYSSEEERKLIEAKIARRIDIDKAWKEGTLYDKKRKN